MVNHKLLVLIVVLALPCIECAQAGTTPQGAGFTYQGILKEGGSPANGAYHLRYQLWDSLIGGVQVGTDLDFPSQVIADGVFSVDLDFGAMAFNGDSRWLQVAVISNGGATVTPLTPRQHVNTVPYAVFALNADGPNLTNLNASNLASGTVDAARLPTGGAWSLSSGLNVDSGTFTIDPINNRVGIGTASPLGPLHVAGNAAGVRLQDDDNAASYAVLEDASTGQLRLDKVAGIGGTLIDINPIPLDTTANAHVRFFRHTNTTGSKLVIFHSGNDSTAASSVIGVGGANSVFQLDGGNFGIGTPTPQAMLHVRGFDPVLVLQDISSPTNQSGYVGFWDSAGVETGWMGYGTPGSPHMTMFNARSNGDITIDAGSGGDINLLAGPNGNINLDTSTGDVIVLNPFLGVGTANPSFKLHAVASNAITTVYAQNTSINGDAIRGESPAGAGIYGVALNTSGAGVGVRGRSDSASGFDFLANGAGTNYGSTSSRRWKRNIQPIDDPLEMLGRLRGVYYDWDVEHGGHHDVGMIAEEVGAVLPEIVNYEENGVDAIGMDYSKLSPLLVEAIKALREEKDAEIARLNNRIDELERLLQEALSTREP